MKERSNGLSIKATSQERLDFNCSSSSVEAIKDLISAWHIENGDVLQRARGTYAPYRIRNRTGIVVSVWSENENDEAGSQASTVRMQSGDSIDWRFDDWKASREVCLICKIFGVFLRLAHNVDINGSMGSQTIMLLVYSSKIELGNVCDISVLTERENMYTR